VHVKDRSAGERCELSPERSESRTDSVKSKYRKVFSADSSSFRQQVIHLRNCESNLAFSDRGHADETDSVEQLRRKVMQLLAGAAFRVVPSSLVNPESLKEVEQVIRSAGDSLIR
jgi:hypothetical protein